MPDGRCAELDSRSMFVMISRSAAAVFIAILLQ